MKQHKHSNIMTNVISYALLQVVTLLVGLVLPRFFLKSYGSEVNGIVATINSFTTYFSYIEAGLGLALVHSLFRPLAEKDIGKTNQILSFSKAQYCKISAAYLCFVMLLAGAFPLVSKSQQLSYGEFFLLVLVIGLYGTFDFYTMAKYRVLLTADQKEYVISNAMTLAQLLRFVFSVLLLRFDVSIVLIKTVPIITLFVRSLILHIYVKKRYPQINFSTISSADPATMTRRWDALLLQISINTSTLLPTIIISQLFGFEEANIYATYSLVISALISVVSALSSGVAPNFGRDLAQGKKLTRKYSIYEALVFGVIATVFSTASVMMLPFIKLYTNVVSDVNYIYPSLAVLSSVWGALYSSRIPSTATINAAGLYKENRINSIINLCIQVVVGVCFALLWKIEGVLLAMIVAALQRNIGYEIINDRNVFHGGLFKRILRQPLLLCVVGGSYGIYQWLFSDVEFNFLRWCITSVFVFMCTSVVCLLLTVFLGCLGDEWSAKEGKR